MTRREPPKNLRPIRPLGMPGDLCRDLSGATAIEYGLIASGIAVAILVIVFALGNELNNTFAEVNSVLGTRP